MPDEKSWIVSDRSLFSTLAYNPCSGEVVKRMGGFLENPAYFGSYNKALIVLLPDEETLLKRLSNRQNEGIPCSFSAVPSFRKHHFYPGVIPLRISGRPPQPRVEPYLDCHRLSFRFCRFRFSQ